FRRAAGLMQQQSRQVFPMPSPRVEHKAFLVLLLLITLAFGWILLPYYGAVFWAVVLAVLFAPLQRRLALRLGGRGNLTALITLLVALLVAVLPVIVISMMLINDGAVVYKRIESGELDIGAFVGQALDALPDPLQ